MKILGAENYNISGRLGPLGQRPDLPVQGSNPGGRGSAGVAGEGRQPEAARNSEPPAGAITAAAAPQANEAARVNGRKLARESAQQLTAETAALITALNPLDGAAAPHSRPEELRLVSPRYV